MIKRIALISALIGSVLATAGPASASSNSFNSSVLTPYAHDVTTISRAPTGVITIAAPSTNSATSNLRSIFWRSNAPDVTNGTACATWLYQSSGAAQEGVALRITPTTAITVTKNVIYGLQWVINVHVWTGGVFTELAGYDMGAVLLAGAHTAPMPWRVCARVIGNQLTFKVWLPETQDESTWTDPVHARTTTVPDGWLAPGKLGYFTGHVPAGGSLQYSETATWSLP